MFAFGPHPLAFSYVGPVPSSRLRRSCSSSGKIRFYRSRCPTQRRKTFCPLSSSSDAASLNDDEDRTTPLSASVSVPRLYDGWFQGTQDLEQGLCQAVERALDQGLTKMEVYFPPVPNLDEVAFGTATNQKFAIEISERMGMSAKGKYAIVRRYLVSFANFYWGCRIVQNVLRPRGIKSWILSTDSVNKSEAIDELGREARVELKSFSSMKTEQLSSGDAILVLDPVGVWKRAAALSLDPTCPVILMNPSFIETYDLVGPLEDFEKVYFLRRISKGWVHRTIGEDWHSFLERPDGSLEVLSRSSVRPKLNEVSRNLRDESFRRYSIFNDRWSKGFGARL